MEAVRETSIRWDILSILNEMTLAVGQGVISLLGWWRGW